MNTTETNNTGENKAEIQYSKYLTFHIGKELYGIEINNVKEVIEYLQSVNITRIPLTPNFIAGVINLRGEVTPVIDLNARFFNNKSVINKRTCIVIINVEDTDEKITLGVMIDSVDAVVDIPDGDIEATPPLGAKIRADFISGIGKIEGKFVILLNINTVLNIEDLSNFNLLYEGANSLLVTNISKVN